MNRHTIFNQGKYGSFHFTMDMQSGSSEQTLRAETAHVSYATVTVPSYLYSQALKSICKKLLQRIAIVSGNDVAGPFQAVSLSWTTYPG